jgi:hypothetical protein
MISLPDVLRYPGNQDVFILYSNETIQDFITQMVTKFTILQAN